MSSGSYLILYRKLAKFKVSDDTYQKTVESYIEDSKSKDYFSDKHKDRHYEDDLPVILNQVQFESGSYYDEFAKKWIQKDPETDASSYLNNNFNQYIGRDDHCRYVKLLEWSFGSSFTALKNMWYLNPYQWKTSSCIISKDTAKQMLEAVNYLLGGEWSDSVELAMCNSFIETFTNGNDSCTYFKYMSRRHAKHHHVSVDGFNVTIDVPFKNNGDDYDDSIEVNESNETVEAILTTLRSALAAYLESDDDYTHNTELVLEYTTY